MKKIAVIATLSIFAVCGVYAEVRGTDVNLNALKAKNLEIANPDLVAIEKRLAALEEDNSKLKKQVAELQGKLTFSTGILDKAIGSLTKDFKGHTHSMGTSIQVTGGSSFKAPGYGAAQFFLTGKSHDQPVETGSAIVK